MDTRLIAFTLIAGFAAGALIMALQAKPSAVAANPANVPLKNHDRMTKVAAIPGIADLYYRVVRSDDGSMSTTIVEKRLDGAVAAQ